MVKGKDSEIPRPRFCVVCETVVTSTERDFRTSGHANEFSVCEKKYAMTRAMFNKVVARLRSGVFGREAQTLEVKEAS